MQAVVLVHAAILPGMLAGMRVFLLLLLLLAVAATARAQLGPTAPRAIPEWLDTPAAQRFRERVIELALIYGDSSGIDPVGNRVVARIADDKTGPCHTVEVRTTSAAAGALLRVERVDACRH